MSYRPDDLYFNTFQPYPSGPADPLPSSTWMCTTCNTTTHIFHRASHLLSRTHIRNSNSLATPPRPQRQTALPFLWRCVPCGEEMHVFHRDEHIASKQHRKNTILAADTIPATDTFTCTTCSALVLLLDVASHLRTSPKWTCTNCDRVVHKSGMELHVAGCTTYSGDGDGGVALERDEDGGGITTGTPPHGGDEVSVGPFLPAPPVLEDLEGTRKSICPYCLRMELGRHRCVGMQCELCGISWNRVDEAAHLNSTRHRMAVEKKEEKEKLRQEWEQTLQNRVDKPANVLPESVLPGPLHRTPSQPTNATANIATVPKMWTCVMCFRTMATASRGAHLQGIKHRNREKLQQKKTQDAAEKRSKQEETKRVVHGKETWDCEVCVRTMSATAKESHLAGVKHRNMQLPAQEEKEGLAAKSRPDVQNGLEMPAKARKSRWQRISVRGSKKKDDAESSLLAMAAGELKRSNDIGKHEAGEHSSQEESTPEKPGFSRKDYWTCDLCVCTMPTMSKESHLAGKEHTSKEGRQVQAKNEEAEYKTHEIEPSGGTKHPRDCRTCARVVLALSKLDPVAFTISETLDDDHKIPEDASQEIHQWAEQPRVVFTPRTISTASPRITPRLGSNILYTEPLLSARQWYCTLCSRVMPLGSRNHHTEGRQHRARYRETKFPENDPGVPRRRIGSGRGKIQEVDAYYCECGNKILGGTWCRDCDFRADAGWGKKGQKL